MSPSTRLEPGNLRSKQDLVLHLQVALCDFFWHFWHPGTVAEW